MASPLGFFKQDASWKAVVRTRSAGGNLPVRYHAREMTVPLRLLAVALDA
jgi:hypothetical protein